MTDYNNCPTMKPPLSPLPQRPTDGAKAAPPAPGLKIRANVRSGTVAYGPDRDR